MKLSFLLFLSLATAAQAQNDFRAFVSSENLVESALVEKLTVVSGSLQFNIRPPREWSRWVDEAGRKVTFTSPSGKSALLIQFTTNSPGSLPEKDILKAQVLKEHPGADIYNTAVCPTSYRPGILFDLAALPTPHVVQKMRHAFVPVPGGEVEFILTASDDEFDQSRLVFMSLVGAFRVDPVKPKPS